ncbi:MAG: hypothetical protein QG584_176 [Pseudomonadota bacterium]|nr:hypothetical protein [Pseudomonadota bacterium]MDQ5914294.1 hypothetical protein [Pseudomonadota bacterium]MDQ5917157.1 hypothetical protein [Pseudomonadota bacterium]
MSLCLVSGSLLAVLPLTAFTLAWTHSIEKTRWEEDWRIHNMKLELTAARIRGSGAGMEIPAGATLRDGVWHYVPTLSPQDGLLLRHSPYVAGYDLCDADHCRPLADLLPGLKEVPGDNAIIELRPCPEGNKP